MSLPTGRRNVYTSFTSDVDKVLGHDATSTEAVRDVSEIDEEGAANVPSSTTSGFEQCDDGINALLSADTAVPVVEGERDLENQNGRSNQNQHGSRTKMLIATVFVVVASAALIVGVAVSCSSNQNVEPSESRNPVLSMAVASLSKSSVPTWSSTTKALTVSPTICTNQASTNIQMLDLLRDPRKQQTSETKVAVDGPNMITAVTYFDTESSRDSLYLTFYSRNSDGMWETVRNFVHEGYHKPHGANVAISGDTALVGLPHAADGNGAVLIYDKYNVGIWELQEESPLLGQREGGYFGSSIDIDEDLACVVNVFNAPSVSIFRRTCEGEWMQIDRVSVHPLYYADLVCRVAGETIAVRESTKSLSLYKYDHGLDKVKPLQTLPANNPGILHYSLSENHLIFLEDSGDPIGNDEDLAYSEHLFGAEAATVKVSVYHRQDASSPFVHLQYLTFLDTEESHVTGFDVDEDILLVGRSDRTYIFTLENRYWKNTLNITSDISIHHPMQYNTYHLSDKHLLIPFEGEIWPRMYSVNLEGCAQPMPKLNGLPNEQVQSSS